MYLLKKFLVSFFIFFIFIANSQDIKIFRSNINGLSLVEIKSNEIKNYKYILKEFKTNGRLTKKTLFKDGKELKRWEYFYNDNLLYNEKYFKENIITEEYYYNQNRHKIRQLEYKNSSLIKDTSYSYNKDGLVEYEEITNTLNNQKTIVRYKYDNQFRIKQLEKKYPDGRIVYWEAFLSEKGIMAKEYYTLKDEMYVFYYNKEGQELKGEILNKTTGKLKKEWENFYTFGGKREKKIEKNIEINEIKITYYNFEALESKIEYYKDDILEKIEKFEYDKNKNLTNYKIIEGLNLKEIVYEYDNDKNLTKKVTYDNDSLKRIEVFNKDGTIDEVLITSKKVRILTKYDKDGKIIIQKEIKQ